VAKDKLTEYDATAANNTVVGDVNLAENSALPSDMNNAVREVMSHLKGFASGTDAIDALTVTGAATVNGAFTSPGIDDNADATAITIDSSENIMLGTVSNPLGKLAIEGGIYLKGSSNFLRFGQDSSTLAGIGIHRPSNTSMAFVTSGNERARVTDNGITFNGDTAAANALDDYEEGTFTVTVASGISVSSYDHQIGHYVKVGRMVTAWVFMEYNGSSRTSSHFIISGLPFTSSNDTSNEATMGGFITYQNSFSNAHNIIHVARNNTKAFFYELDGSDLIGSELSGASGEVRFVVQYTVA